jgi:TrmH family RNA methyltransferase
LFERPRWTVDQIFSSDRLAVALDGVQDPGNVGTIVRLAAAFDAAGVILLSGCADPYGPKAIRASAGAILNVPIVSMSVEELLAAGRPIFVADAKGSTTELPTGVLVLGSEGQGLSPALRKAGRAISIQTSGRVESLNVAAAAAILLWRSFV